MQLLAATSAALALAVASVSAHGPGSGSGTHGFVKRATSTGTPTESSIAQVTDSAQECTAYYVAEVAALRYNYPTVSGSVAGRRC